MSFRQGTAINSLFPPRSKYSTVVQNKEQSQRVRDARRQSPRVRGREQRPEDETSVPTQVAPETRGSGTLQVREPRVVALACSPSQGKSTGCSRGHQSCVGHHLFLRMRGQKRLLVCQEFPLTSIKQGDSRLTPLVGSCSSTAHA